MTWHRLSTKKSHLANNTIVRRMALEQVLKHLSYPTVQEIRRKLGMSAKSSLYASAWWPLIVEYRKKGKIAPGTGQELAAGQPRRARNTATPTKGQGPLK